MPTITVQLTTEDLQQLVNLLDAAIRHTGIQGATVALPLIQKLQAAHQAAMQEQKPPT